MTPPDSTGQGGGAAGDESSRHYDLHDSWYRAIWGEHLHHGLWEAGTASREAAAIAMIRRVADAARIGPGTRVCDVGCGYGGTARWLAEHTGADVLGVTNSRRQWETASAADTGNPRFRLADWLENGLPDGAFDVVIAIESTPHFARLGEAVSEMMRVLKPGGRLVISTWLREAEEMPALLKPVAGFGHMPSLVPEARLRQWMEEAGGRAFHGEDLTARVARTWTACWGRALKEFTRSPELRRSLWRHPLAAMRFGTNAMRVWTAYRTGVLRYALLACSRG